MASRDVTQPVSRDATYDPDAAEREAQSWWEARESFRAREDPAREPYYCLSMFPYPSGRLHMGHVRNYTIGDVIARYQRMLGRNVLQPMGWDAFGLPAENAAIENRVPPAQWTRRNIEYMRDQLKRMGFGYDWTRELATCDPEYYRWEQWLFLRLFEQGMVYRRTAPVNWCPHDRTVLANEQVVEGRCWRCDSVVERREIPQWFMRITAYADELTDALDDLDGWPEQVRTMQRNWIGRSEGVEIEFGVAGREQPLTVFTTRPDTLMGVTYMAVAPEHPLAAEAAAGQPELARFVEECQRLQTSEAALETMEKRGMPTGFEAVHPVTGARVPVFVANFVLMAYGEGAVMAVPAHDQRDWEFAQHYGLPIRQVIAPAEGGEADLAQGAWTEPGVLVDSGEFTGLTSAQAFERIADHLESRGLGRRRLQYRLRDWGVSRQRYWGAPIPMINCARCGEVPVPESDLPVRLPEDVEFDGVGSPLKRMPGFYETTCPRCGGDAERETDTFDTFMESSWYYARYTCPDNDEAMLDERADYWLPVTQYIGGIEHAILHLLYARFYHKVLRDAGLVRSDEPFTHLLTQGMVLKDGAKMSKSKGNTVDPQALIDHYGADTVRLFTMFAAPPDQALEWSDSGAQGAYRFLKRLWAFAREHKERRRTPEPDGLTLDPDALSSDQARTRSDVHQFLQQINQDVDRFQFNTVVSGAMKMLNTLGEVKPGEGAADDLIDEALGILLRVLAPVVPHITHVLWRDLGYGEDVLEASWPSPDPEALVRDEVELVVQVNGKVRSRITVPAGSDREALESAALADANVQRFVADQPVKKVVVVPDKLVNVVV